MLRKGSERVITTTFEKEVNEIQHMNVGGKVVNERSELNSET